MDKQSIISKLLEGYEKNGMRAEVADAPTWMGSCDKLVVVFRKEGRFILTLHCVNSKDNKIVATF